MRLYKSWPTSHPFPPRFDRATQRSRGFGFVTFAEEGSARAVMSQPHVFHGKTVDVKSAQPAEEMGMPPGGGGGGFGGGGGGGHYGPPGGGFRPF